MILVVVAQAIAMMGAIGLIICLWVSETFFTPFGTPSATCFPTNWCS